MALTLKQQMFVTALVGPAAGNRTLAAGMAGYKGNLRALAVQGHRNMKNKEVRRMIDEILEQLRQRALERVSDALDATKHHLFPTKEGGIIYSEDEVDHAIRLRAADRIFKQHERLFGNRRGSPSGVASLEQPGQLSVERSREVAGIDSTDRALLRQVADIDQKLAELERQDPEADQEEQGKDDSD